jgi:hypothetical protein
LGDLWKEDSKFGGRIFVLGTHPVHGHRSQHLQLDGRIGEQYLLDGFVEQLSGINELFVPFFSFSKWA